MPCPCFSPTVPRARDTGSKSILLPLGDSFLGVCLADPAQPAEPEESRLALCNLGYARGECPRFPVEAADAVRFALSRDNQHSLQIYYVLERGHHPVEHGELTFLTNEQTLSPPASNPILHRQAAAYAASYLRRKDVAAAK